jgi:hypothetical protein
MPIVPATAWWGTSSNPKYTEDKIYEYDYRCVTPQTAMFGLDKLIGCVANYYPPMSDSPIIGLDAGMVNGPLGQNSKANNTHSNSASNGESGANKGVGEVCSAHLGGQQKTSTGSKPSSVNEHSEVNGPAHNAANAERYRQQLGEQEKIAASAQQLADAMRGAPGARLIAGPGTDTVLRDALRLAQTYGGRPQDWQKWSSPNFKPRRGPSFEIHWYANPQLNMRVEFKTKLLSGSVRGQ